MPTAPDVDAEGVPTFPDPPADLRERFEQQERERRDLGEDSWKNRIVRSGRVDPNTLLEHPDNWRAHPDHQKAAMKGALVEIGWVDSVKVSERSNRILNGHMRVAIAIKAGQKSVPVDWIDCPDEASEDRILATYDPIGQLAVKDIDSYRLIQRRAGIKDDALRALVEHEAELDLAGSASGGEGDPDTSPVDVPDVWGVVVECQDEQQQAQLLEMLTEEGYTCRALLS